MPNLASHVIPSTGGYEIDYSTRLNTNAYYQRTPSSASNRRTWTWSGWVKLGAILNGYRFLFAGGSGSTERTQILLFVEGYVRVSNVSSAGSWDTYTNTKLRDPSAWYHLVVSVDTTQATASDRVKIYTNGEQHTIEPTGSYPPQNQDLLVNTTNTHYIGKEVHTGNVWDGYMSEVHFVDGQALDASYFGETDATYGHWKPIKYTGTYGTNGFYLDFATRATDPIDASGNGNNWGSVNVVSTDWMLDTPTNNFCTMNPLDKNADQTLLEGNLQQVQGSTDQWDSARSTYFVGSGKWYWEAALTDSQPVSMIGVSDNLYNIQANASSTYVGFYTNSWSIYTNSGDKRNNAGSGTTYGSSFASGDVVMVALDMDNGKIWWGKNGTWFASGDPVAGTNAAYTNLSGYEVSPSSSVYNYVADITHNFGQDSSFAGNKTAQGNTDANGIGDFYYEPPSGYLALCTQNLPEPTVAPADHFNTVLYTGDGTTNGATQSITGVGFQPDFVWLKHRDATNTASHVVTDSVRGALKVLRTNGTDAENATDINPLTYDGVSAYNADGFTAYRGSSGTYNGTNGSGKTYVAWNWKANGSGVSNTDGTITSTVSANQDAGFSIVSYTGNNTNAATVGHGLNSTPDMVITKSRSATSLTGWMTSHTSLASNYNLALNLTDAAWNPSSNGWVELGDASAFTLKNGSTDGNNANQNGVTYIAYCFHSVDGFSKIGSYTGNGSSDGPFVYTGFRPAFVMVKNASASGNYWEIVDSVRDPDNITTKSLFPNTSDAESTYDKWDFLSNGFKIRTTSSGSNTNGYTYIFMAFAENPFKYSTAR